jgi:hypothetical protein
MPSTNFDPRRDHRISREEAASLIQAFQAKAQAGTHRASTFNHSAFEQLLAQPGAVGIRIYRAEHKDGSPTMVMVAVDGEGVDLDNASAVFMQFSHDCPPYCAGTGLTKT